MKSDRAHLIQPARPAPRSGLVVFELLIWLPVLVIFLLAIVEFGQIYALDQQVALASRFGAKIASETSRSQLPTLATSGTLSGRVQDYLRTANIQNGPCSVTLTHNACVTGQQQQFPAVTPATCRCPAPVAPGTLPTGTESPIVGTNPREAYVRVTVCVPLRNNVPNLLTTFGFDVGDSTLVHTTTLRYEVNNQAPSAVIQLENSLPSGVTRTNGSLPANCSSDCNVQLRASFAGGAPDPISLSFNANLSTDPDNTITAYSWSTTGTPTSATSGTSFTASFDRADVIMGTITGTNPRSYTVTLTVTDSCGRQSQQTMTITITTTLL